MKSLILIPLLLISTNHFSQDKSVVNSESVTDRANHWMTNIATNRQLRFEMVQKILAQTKDKRGEMMRLANQILENSEMKKMIKEAAVKNAEKKNKYVNMLDKIKKDKKIMKKTAARQKPIIKD